MQMHRYTFAAIAAPGQSDSGKQRTYSVIAYAEPQARVWMQRDIGPWATVTDLLSTEPYNA